MDSAEPRRKVLIPFPASIAFYAVISEIVKTEEARKI
jgi:hypothetical protein